MAGTQITTSVTIINSMLGFQGISLTNFATSAESQIAAGSKVEIASAFFTFSSDEQPSGWSAITTGETAYIACTPSGTAGSQILSPAWTEDAPIWSDSKQGWYGSAASSTRFVGKVEKTSATQYDDARVLLPLQGTSGPVLHAESIDVTGDLDVAGRISTETLRVGGVAVMSGTLNREERYTLLSPHLPNIGDQMLVSGFWEDTDGLVIATYAARVDTITIGIWGGYTDTTKSITQQLTAVLGDAGGDIRARIVWYDGV